MKYFLGTANVDAITRFKALGKLDGGTTNPTIIVREGRDFDSLLEESWTIVHRFGSAVVTGRTREEVIE